MPQLHEKEVRMFYYNLAISGDGMYVTLQINRVDMGFDEETLSEILEAPTIGIKTIRSQEGSAPFLGMCSDLNNLNNKSIKKRVLNEVYQLFFELVHRALLPISKKRGIVTSPDLYLMEILSIY